MTEVSEAMMKDHKHPGWEVYFAERVKQAQEVEEREQEQYDIIEGLRNLQEASSAVIRIEMLATEARKALTNMRVALDALGKLLSEVNEECSSIDDDIYEARILLEPGE